MNFLYLVSYLLNFCKICLIPEPISKVELFNFGEIPSQKRVRGRYEKGGVIRTNITKVTYKQNQCLQFQRVSQ